MKIFIKYLLLLSLVSCQNSQTNNLKKTVSKEKVEVDTVTFLTPVITESIVEKVPAPIKREELSVRISQVNIKYQNIPFITSLSQVENIKGKPDSIIEPNYECGPFSEEWQQMKFYQYFYGNMNFIVYNSKAEIQEIKFRKGETITIKNVLLSKETNIIEAANELGIELLENSDSTSITIYPKENPDEWYYLQFENNKLYLFDRFEPC